MNLDSGPLHARALNLKGSVGPVAFNCVKFIAVTEGSGSVSSRRRHIELTEGDVVIVAAHEAFNIVPDTRMSLIDVSLDMTYVLEQFYWEHGHKLEALPQRDIPGRQLYAEPVQIVTPAVEHVPDLYAQLNNLVALCADGGFREHFHRVQSVWFRALAHMAPQIRYSALARFKDSDEPGSGNGNRGRYRPLRREVRRAAALMRDQPEYAWTVGELASAVHMSPAHFGRLFREGYGITPTTYLRQVRAQRLAELLRTTDLPVSVAMREVGWKSRGHAAMNFRKIVGCSPSEYRNLNRSPLTPT